MAVAEAGVGSAADRCLEGWGPELLGYLLGAGLDGDLAGWRLADALRDPELAARLDALRGLLLLFDEPGQARAWIRNLSPELDRRSPATVIRHHGSDAFHRVRVLAEGHPAKR